MPFHTFRFLSLLGESCELEPAAISSAEDSFILLFSSSKTKVEFRELATLLARALVLLPVAPICIETLGVLTTKDDSNLSFFFGCSGARGKASGASIFLLLSGKILALMSCKLWSGLQVIKGSTQGSAKFMSTNQGLTIAFMIEMHRKWPSSTRKQH